MRAVDHPDYWIFQKHQQRAKMMREVWGRWRQSGEVLAVPDYALLWTVDRVAHFFAVLNDLFMAYNRLLWEEFAYCRICLGRCCTHAVISAVDDVDFLALAVLGAEPPEAGEESELRGDRCIYLSQHRCGWPAVWRTHPCWSYYCLGPDFVLAELAHEAKDLNQRYSELAQSLFPVIEDRLPDELRVYERQVGILYAGLAGQSPTAFAVSLQHGIEAILLKPLLERFQRE